jgi:nucleoid-associated protein
MNINEAILHHIAKEPNTSGADAVRIHPRAEALAADQRLEQTVIDLLKVYGKSTSGYGTFDANQTVCRFPVLLSDYTNAQANLITFSQEATKLIADKMKNEHFATGGYALFLRYDNQGQDWVLVVMLKLKPGTGVDEQTLELSDTLSLDIEHLHEAARIDLAKWKNNEQPYLSFIKKRQGGADVSRYFREALGCTEYTDAQHNTETARTAYEDFCKDQKWSAAQKQAGRQRVYDYYEAKHQANEPVNLQALSAIIDDQNPEAFVTFVREKGFEVNDTFQPHRNTYRRLKRIARKFGSVNVSFEVDDVIAGRVDFDENNKCLVIKDPPDALIAEINGHKT